MSAENNSYHSHGRKNNDPELIKFQLSFAARRSAILKTEYKPILSEPCGSLRKNEKKPVDVKSKPHALHMSLSKA
jgi:hypothetical protein